MAAEQGVDNAQALLGGMYYVGVGVPRDYVEAYMWLSLATAQGIGRAEFDSVERTMTPDQIAEAQKRAAAWKPVQSRQ
jgi:TPR repeat protein